jgi:hypothetical protein
MDDLAGLAHFLATRRSAIVERCVSVATLDDEVAHVLQAFERHLARGPEATTSLEEEVGPTAMALGERRWRQNRSIADVVREVTLLETIVLEALDDFQQQNADASPSRMTAARKRLAEFCGVFTALTVTEYANAKHADAASQINRLELDLNRTTELERQRAQTWRKAAHDLRGSLSVIGNASSVLVLPNVPDQMRAECGAILERGVDTLRTRLEACIEQAQQITT